ncbi:MAG: preprotein translocase subunit SecA [Deltaproteobacteria bacterium]|jgi:preprotein translocase subunit SecA|nr:preprotein translocase subunit SecA [Deltaproteobacteria bacterium]
MLHVFRKLFGTANDRAVAKLAGQVDRICELEPAVRRLSDAELKGSTARFKERLANGEDLESVVPEAFAAVREAGARVLGQRHFDVQLMGGLVLHQGRIAEMKTGEGKTLAATLPVYANALTGRGVHVVTVNDYLARRDAVWMGRIYSYLGLTTGVIVHGLSDAQRRAAYRSDITYGTNNEFGFDYLRDNMKFAAEEFVQREFNFAIVDEVDSILIDEARTPLIISGKAEDSTQLYERANRVIPGLEAERDFTVDEKARQAALTEEGIARAERALGVANLYDPLNMTILHNLEQALKAHTLFNRDKEYLVKDGQVVIVDEFTGRPMPGRRFSDGLHQALEAKERVRVENENQTLASITFQNYFRMYAKLAGMTGTADTEAAEFAKIYNLEVVIVPTHRKMVRLDHNDVVYATVAEKYEAVVEEIAALHAKGQPVLVGTISINNSEVVSKLLKARHIPHQVLNAKHLEKEAQIVSQAGQKSMVTISTNMAGRGTDIVLGHEVPALGGLFILGTERHESRRIDNQLRGRSGRQGDPGESRFYLSLEDDLMRIFGGDRFKGILSRLGLSGGEPLTAPIITKSIERAQKQVESRNFDIRKHLLDYDDVMNRQREVVYRQRRAILANRGEIQPILDLVDEESQVLVRRHLPDRRSREDLKFEDFALECRRLFGFLPEAESFLTLSDEGMMDQIFERGRDFAQAKMAALGEENYFKFTNWIRLSVLDNMWKDHLLNMDRLRDGINLRSYAQKDPLREYQHEGFEMFEEMIGRIRAESLVLITNFTLERVAAPVVDVEAGSAEPGGEPEDGPGARAAAPDDGDGGETNNGANDGAGGGQGGDGVRRAPAKAAPAREGRRPEPRMAPTGGPVVVPPLPRRQPQNLTFSRGSSSGGSANQPERRAAEKIPRNSPCPCGSGKK